MKGKIETFGIDQQAFRLLMRVAMMLSEQERYDESDSILRAMIAYRPDIPHPRLCLVIGLMFRGGVDEAIGNLYQALAEFPDCQVARAILGFALREAGDQDWQAPLMEVLDDGRDEWAIRFSKDVLGYQPQAQAISEPSEPCEQFFA
jgi:Bacterial type III secretion protein (HrpB1_HrpK)